MKSYVSAVPHIPTAALLATEMSSEMVNLTSGLVKLSILRELFERDKTPKQAEGSQKPSPTCVPHSITFFPAWQAYKFCPDMGALPPHCLKNKVTEGMLKTKKEDFLKA